MSKTTYEVYELGSKVWGISHIYSEGKQTDNCAIYPATVDSVYLAYDISKPNNAKIEYLLKTPEGEDWGDSVDAEYVSDVFEEVVARAKVDWDKHASTF